MKRSVFNKIINELCSELEIGITEFSDHWIYKLEKSGQVHFILGNRFDLNSAASAHIADDKVGTYDVLNSANIPAIEHKLIIDTDFLHTNTISDAFKANLERIFASAIYPLVLKPNRGSSGQGVTFCKSKEEAFQATLSLLNFNKILTYSPYFSAPNEYRCFFLDGKILLIYKKLRNFDWRHNLSHGSTPEIIPENTEQHKSLSNLAIRAGKALNLRFATIDILESGTGEKRVLEINQGVSTTIFSSFSQENYELAKNIYRSALKSLFNLK